MEDCKRINLYFNFSMKKNKSSEINMEWGVVAFIHRVASSWRVEREVLNDMNEYICPYRDKKCPFDKNNKACEIVCGVMFTETEEPYMPIRC